MLFADFSLAFSTRSHRFAVGAFDLKLMLWVQQNGQEHHDIKIQIARKEKIEMKNAIIIGLLVFSVSFVGCGHKKFHQGSMPDPEPYMIHYHELDADGDDTVSWEEFKGRFPDSSEDVFKAVDQDGDGFIDHDEWHTFKEAHGAEQ